MKERPILFNGDMVRAILSGQKTQTRRIMKTQPYSVENDNGVAIFYASDDDETGGKTIGEKPFIPPAMVGDRAWVRETWAETDLPCGTPVVTYRAGGCIPIGRQREINTDFLINQWATSETPQPEKWQPSIHMPRWASRITLEITSVRVERLQDISIDDSFSEASPLLNPPFIPGCYAVTERGPVKAFAKMWGSIYGEENWDANPWVWVIEFKRIATSEKN